MSTSTTDVLITTAGRKYATYAALAASSRAGRLVTTDADPASAIARRAPLFRRVPPVADEARFVEALLELCTATRVDCLLPLNDRDLGPLARAADRFRAAGVRCLGVSEGIEAAMRDKLEAARWLTRQGFATPPTVEVTEARDLARDRGLPLLAKARAGQGSQGLTQVTDEAGLARLDPDLVVQPRLAGVEHNLDILRDPVRGVVSVVVKRKLAMRDGSTERAVTVEDPDLVDLGVSLGDALGLVGPADVDVLVTAEGPVVLDVNPRLGGGFPFAAAACPAYVDALLDIGRGKEVAPFLGRYQIGLTVYREAVYLPLA